MRGWCVAAWGAGKLCDEVAHIPLLRAVVAILVAAALWGVAVTLLRVVGWLEALGLVSGRGHADHNDVQRWLEELAVDLGTEDVDI